MKIMIFCDFRDFWILMMRSIIRPEPAGNVKFGRQWVLWTPKILLHTLYVIIWWLEQIFKNSGKKNFSFFLPYFTDDKKNGKKNEKQDFFLRILKICSSHNIITYKVCRSILGVQRTHFRSNSHFRPNNRSHHQNSKNLKISKNHDFRPKKSIFSKGLYWLIWWNMGKNGPLGAVSYTHLTLPTKRIV